MCLAIYSHESLGSVLLSLLILLTESEFILLGQGELPFGGILLDSAVDRGFCMM